jgi:hypothetical protein
LKPLFKLVLVGIISVLCYIYIYNIIIYNIIIINDFVLKYKIYIIFSQKTPSTHQSTMGHDYDIVMCGRKSGEELPVSCKNRKCGHKDSGESIYQSYNFSRYASVGVRDNKVVSPDLEAGARNAVLTANARFPVVPQYENSDGDLSADRVKLWCSNDLHGHTGAHNLILLKQAEKTLEKLGVSNKHEESGYIPSIENFLYHTQRFINMCTAYPDYRFYSDCCSHVEIGPEDPSLPDLEPELEPEYEEYCDDEEYYSPETEAGRIEMIVAGVATLPVRHEVDGTIIINTFCKAMDMYTRCACVFSETADFYLKLAMAFKEAGKMGSL